MSDPYFAKCCKEMPLATNSCNGRQWHVWGGMSIRISANPTVIQILLGPVITQAPRWTRSNYSSGAFQMWF